MSHVRYLTAVPGPTVSSPAADDTSTGDPAGRIGLVALVGGQTGWADTPADLTAAYAVDLTLDPAARAVAYKTAGNAVHAGTARHAIAVATREPGS
jgi:hypothetical protein